MGLNEEEFEKELDELLVCVSNNINKPLKKFTPQDLLSAAIDSQAAKNMRDLINENKIAEDEDELPFEVIQALKEAHEAHEMQRILDEQRKQQLRKELTDLGWKPPPSYKNRDYGIPVLKRMLKKMKKRRKKLLNDLETLGYAFFLFFFDIERHTNEELEKIVKEAKVKAAAKVKAEEKAAAKVKATEEKAAVKAAEKRERLLIRAVAVGHPRGDFDDYNNDDLEDFVKEYVAKREKLLNQAVRLGRDWGEFDDLDDDELESKLQRIKKEVYAERAKERKKRKRDEEDRNQEGADEQDALLAKAKRCS